VKQITGTCSEGHQQCRFIKHSGISWPLVSNFLSYEDSQNTGDDIDDPEQADKGDIKMEVSSDKLCSPSIGAVIKKLPVRT